MTPSVWILYDFAFLIVVRMRLSRQATALSVYVCLKWRNELKAFATSISDTLSWFLTMISLILSKSWGS
jgi:hypothetical protein